MAEVAIIIPTLGRSQVLGALVQNIADTTPEPYTLLFVVNHGDSASRVECSQLPCRTLLRDGTYPVKTNAGVEATNEPFVLLTADDVVFHDDWLEAALEAFRPGIEVVGTNDLTPATEDGLHATMPIVRRSYIEDPGAAYGEPGVAFHEGYHHNFVETELWQLANHREVARFVPESRIEHCHPCWGTNVVDATYERGSMSHWDDDSALFERRMAEWSK